MIDWLLSDVSVPAWYYILVLMMASGFAAIAALALLRYWGSRHEGKHRL